MTDADERARRAAAESIGARIGVSKRQALAALDGLERAGLIVPIDNYRGGVWMTDLEQVVKTW